LKSEIKASFGSKSMPYFTIVAFLVWGFLETALAQNARLDSLQNLLRQPQVDSQKVNIWTDIAYILEDTRPDTALIIAQKALSLAQKIDFPMGVLKSSFRVGYAYQALGKYEVALQFYLQHLQLSEAQQDFRRIGRSYYAMGVINKLLGKFQSGLSFMHKARQAYEKSQDEAGLTRCFNALGELYDTLQQPAQARVYFQKSIARAEKLKNVRAMIYAYLNLAKIYQTDRQMTLAEATYQKIIEMASAPANLYPQLQARNALAYQYLSQQNWNTAQEILLPALSHYASKDILVLGEVKQAYFGLSQIYYAQKEYLRAYEYLKLGNNLQDSLSKTQKIAEFAKIQATFDWEKQQQKINLLEKEKKLTAINNQQKLYLAFGIIGFLLLISGSLLYRNLLKRQSAKLMEQKNRELINQKEEVAVQSEKLLIANEQIKKTNLSLSEALQELAQLNEELENKVTERTFSLQQKNEQLAEYAFLNAHKLRAPLATMLGLIGLLKEQELPLEASHLLQLLQTTACSLDQVIHKIQQAIEDIEANPWAE
jgi:hypothetical protein